MLIIESTFLFRLSSPAPREQTKRIMPSHVHAYGFISLWVVECHNLEEVQIDYTLTTFSPSEHGVPTP